MRWDGKVRSVGIRWQLLGAAPGQGQEGSCCSPPTPPSAAQAGVAAPGCPNLHGPRPQRAPARPWLAAGGWGWRSSRDSTRIRMTRRAAHEMPCQVPSQGSPPSCQLGSTGPPLALENPALKSNSSCASVALGAVAPRVGAAAERSSSSAAAARAAAAAGVIGRSAVSGPPEPTCDRTGQQLIPTPESGARPQMQAHGASAQLQTLAARRLCAPCPMPGAQPGLHLSHLGPPIGLSRP